MNSSAVGTRDLTFFASALPRKEENRRCQFLIYAKL